jgi:glycosyltransferase involved in cell wall biosynthesis
VAGSPKDAYILFFGTLEPRKNIGALIEAYERVSRRRPFPRLVLAGKATEAARPWLDRIEGGPLRDRIHCRGYIEPSERQQLYAGALCLVQPSFDEGFGLPVLEAMTVGVPVVAANRGALPEVLGDAGLLVDGEDPDELASAIERVADDETLQAQCAARGIERAQTFTWEGTARRAFTAYQRAIQSRSERRGAA